MFLNSRLFVAVIVLLSLHGCVHIARFDNGTRTDANKSAEFLMRQMSRAESLEISKKYPEAAGEYALIADSRPVTIYHKDATQKAAMLNIHPDNPEIDYEASLKYFNVLLELPIHTTDKDYARQHIALIEKILSLEKEVFKLVRDNNNLVSSSRIRAKKLADKLGKNRQLELELTRVKEEVVKMKKVDLFLHKNRSTAVK